MLSGILQVMALGPEDWNAPPYRGLAGNLLLLLSGLACLGILVGGGVALASKPSRQRARSLLALTVGAAWIGGCAVSQPLAFRNREASVLRIVKRADRVAEAIENYDREMGRPPASPLQLVPEYLKEADLPSRGSIWQLRYASVSTPDQYWFSWRYDLGMPSHHAGPELLVDFTARGKARRIDILFDDGVAPVPFDSERWCRDDVARRGMAYDLRRSRMLIGRDTSAVLRMLCDPTSRVNAYAGSWFLAVAERPDFFRDYDALIIGTERKPMSDESNAARIGRWWWCQGCYERLPDP